MAAKKDIVIAAAAGYEWPDVEPWARSLVASGFAGVGAVIVYDRDDRGDAIAENLEALGLYAVRMPPPDSVYNGRFQDIAQVLRMFAPSLRFAVVTDVRDVYFQSDPITWLETHLRRPFLAVSEGLRYSDEKWNRDNLQRSFPAHVQRLWSKPVCNVGVLAGEAGVMADLCLAISLVAASSGVSIADQSGYNLLLDMEPYRSAMQFVPSEDGFACQAGTFADPGKIGTLRPFLLEPEPSLVGESVHTATGMLYPIVHQYDRVPEWRQALSSRLRSAPAPGGSASRPGLARVLGDADGSSVLRTAQRFGVPRNESSIRLFSADPDEFALADGSPTPRDGSS
ncbi:hypothetical protein [Nocardia araoensis]|uniref:hypothetical protein n=1 Tax=Nocardia araoensis TaxID=228600 RepID=UPI0002E4FF1D|nr:hypothetical protein [Nocardia araoensis]